MEIRNIRERNRIAERLSEMSVPLDLFRAHVRGLAHRSDVSPREKQARKKALRMLEKRADAYRDALKRFAATR